MRSYFRFGEMNFVFVLAGSQTLLFLEKRNEDIRRILKILENFSKTFVNKHKRFMILRLKTIIFKLKG